MEQAFWDSSALVPICVQRQAGATVRQLVRRYAMVVWWTTPVEMRSAFTRLLRMGQLTSSEHISAGQGLDQLRHGWRELQPTEQLRVEAETLVDRFPLKAADALQLAAALAWTLGKPHNRLFISGDAQLLEAARQLGFQTIEA
jgi:predicted nucleic acid-binding protein